MSKANTKLESAIITIAKFFDDPVTNQDGEVTNRLAYTQARILNSLCYGAAQSLERTKTSTLPKATDEVRQAMRAHRGDELSELTLTKKLDWLDRVNDQIAHLEAFGKIAEDVYQRTTGEAFVYGTRKAAASTRETDAMARAAAALGDKLAPAADFNSGIDSTEIEHGVNEPARVTSKKAAA